MLVIVTFLVLAVLTVVLGTAVAALRGASRTRLLDVLGGPNVEAVTDGFFRHRRAYSRSVLIAQQAVHLASAAAILLVCEDISSLVLRWTVFGLAALTWILVFGVGIPVGWARYRGDHLLAVSLNWLELFRRAMRPPLAAVTVMDELVRRLSGSPKEPTDKAEQIELEIMDAVSQGEISGTMNPSEKEIIRSALALDETSVAEVMTPRTDIVGVDAGASYDEVRRAFLSEGHSRIPVHEGSLDQIIGILYAKDLLRMTDARDFGMKSVMRPAMFVPETKDLSSLLREFQRGRVHIAVVLDEYGGTAGLVTLENIVEELIGEIADEHEAPPPAMILRIDDHTAEVDARVRVEEVNETFELELPEDESYDTIAGFVFSKLGRIPSRGDVAVEGGVRIEVAEADDRCIRRLRLHLPDRVSVVE